MLLVSRCIRNIKLEKNNENCTLCFILNSDIKMFFHSFSASEITRCILVSSSSLDKYTFSVYLLLSEFIKNMRVENIRSVVCVALGDTISH